MTDKQPERMTDEQFEYFKGLPDRLQNDFMDPDNALELWEGMQAERTHANALQAKIDRLMLEYCPDEMTPEQIKEWGRNQAPVDYWVSVRGDQTPPHEFLPAELRKIAAKMPKLEYGGKPCRSMAALMIDEAADALTALQSTVTKWADLFHAFMDYLNPYEPVCDLDGGSIQDVAVKCGILVPHRGHGAVR